MKTFSKLALTAVLATGVGGMAIVVPATAAKKEEAQKPGLKLSPEVLKPAQVAQTAIAAKDVATAEPAVAQAEAAAKTDDEKYIAASLRLNVEQLKLAAQQVANPNAPINETALAQPLDILIVNPNTAPDQKARFAFARGQLAFNGKQYPQAIQYFTQAQQLGATDPNLPLLLVKARIESGDVAGGLADLDKVVQQAAAGGTKAPEDYYRYGLAKATAAKLKPETMAWLMRFIGAYPSAKNWRDVLVIYGLQQNALATLDKSQKMDVFRLMRASGALADQYDFEEYAQYARDKGLPAEAITVINQGMASGKVPAGPGKALLADAQASQRNEGSLSTLETKSKTAATGTLAAGTGDAYLGQGNYAKAVDLYKVALTKGGVNADEVNTHLGIALAQSGDKTAAQAAFAQVKGAPRTDIAMFWTTWLTTPPAA